MESKDQKKFWSRPIVLAVVIGVTAALTLTAVFVARRSSQSLSLKRGSIVEAVYGVGTVQSNKVFRLKSGVATGIKRIFVREGDLVKKGTPLVELEESGIQRAPFEGTISSVGFEAGETAFPQAPILTLMDLQDRYVSVSIEQQGALRIRRGQPAALSFESLRGEKIFGTVRSIVPNEGQFLVDLKTDGLPQEVLPGMTADVVIEIEHRENALLIPTSSLMNGRVRRETSSGRFEIVDVKIGVIDGEWAEVTSANITENDRVLVRKR